VAKRAALGLARLGSYSGTSSGDLIMAFSTVPDAVNGPDQKSPSPITPVADTEVNAVFEATVQATEEAIVNALVAAHTSTGADGYTMYGLPHRELALRSAIATRGPQMNCARCLFNTGEDFPASTRISVRYLVEARASRRSPHS
jgi:hypothetical protein